MNGVQRAQADPARFNQGATLPYQLHLADFELAMQDIHDLLFDINSSLVSRGLQRMEEIIRPAGFSGLLSDALTTAVARHSRVLVQNQYHNGHPDLIPRGRYAKDSVHAGEEGVEVKATLKAGGAVDTHGARNSWLCVFVYKADTRTEPATQRAPTRVVQIFLAYLTTDDFRRNLRGELGTRTASPNREGVAKLRVNWIYQE